jgi:hypothetical protein
VNPVMDLRVPSIIRMIKSRIRWVLQATTEQGRFLIRARRRAPHRKFQGIKLILIPWILRAFYKKLYAKPNHVFSWVSTCQCFSNVCSSARNVSRRESLRRIDIAVKRGGELPQVVIRLPGANVTAPSQLSLANSVQFTE